MAKSASATDMFPFSGTGEPLQHGGDLAAARRLFPGAPEPFIDLSTGINPNPYPLPVLPAEIFARLPDRTALQQLATAAATAYGAPSAAYVVPAPGTQILLPLVCGLVRPGRAAILTPTYSEHARAAALSGHAVAEIRDIGAIGNAESRGCHQSQQSGRPTARQERFAGAARKPYSRAAASSWSTRPSWMPGRLARALPPNWRAATSSCCARSANSSASPGCGSALRWPRRRSPHGYRRYSVRGRFQGRRSLVGAKALADHAWIEKSRRSLAKAATRLDAILGGAGLDIIGGTTLFRLARTRSASELFHHLGRAGILTRIFPDHAMWLRFGLPAAEPDWQRLQIAMAAFRDNG